MGTSDTDEAAEDPKTLTPPPPTSQEQSSATGTGTVNPEWPGYQAYSPIPPPGFMASSPQAHPYMWSVQHIMPPHPYGTPSPHPYVAMYPPGVYPHPSIPPGAYPFSPFPMIPIDGTVEASVNMPVEGKFPEGKEKLPVKRSKGSLGSLNMITGKDNEQDKATAPSANGVHSKSCEGASDGSTEDSEANSQNDSHINSEDGRDSAEANGSQNGNAAHGAQNGILNTHHTVVNATLSILPISAAPPTTNVNIGMDYWGTAAALAMHATVPPARTATGFVATGPQDNMQSQLWFQDDRENKRQRRKQSNRESARRSRLRKQAECDELALQAESLKEENANLRSEVNRIREEYEQILAEHKLLKERLGDVSEDMGPEKMQQDLTSEAQQKQSTGANSSGGE